MKVKVNNVPGYRKGQIVEIAVSETGQVKSPFWRRRIKDAEFDNCCEIIKDSSEKKTEPKPKKTESDKVGK